MRTIRLIAIWMILPAAGGCSSETTPPSVTPVETLLQTPAQRFANLPDFAFAPKSLDVGGAQLSYLDEGPPGALPVLLLHGLPSWSYLYRHTITAAVAAGYRVIAPDLLGFGRSDKPAAASGHSYARHVSTMVSLVTQLDLQAAVLVAHDWGGPIGLRMLVEQGERFRAVLVANTSLLDGPADVGDDLRSFQALVEAFNEVPVGNVVALGTLEGLDETTVAAYDAPFPDLSYQAGVYELARIIPNSAADTGAALVAETWAYLETWTRPFLTAFSDGDPITAGYDLPFQERVPGAATQPHTTITAAGHFLQEDRPGEFNRVLLTFLATLPTP